MTLQEQFYYLMNLHWTVLTGGIEGLAAMKFLHSSKGVRFVTFTNQSFIHLLYNDTYYWINVDIDNSDYAGADDILSATFCCSYIMERDPLRAFVLGLERCVRPLKQS